MSATAIEYAGSPEAAEAAYLDYARFTIDSLADRIYDRVEDRPSMEDRRPNEIHEKITDIDLKAHAEAGRKTLLIDAENTFVRYGGVIVKPEIQTWFADARDAGIENIVITTNKKIRDVKDAWLVQGWVEQVGADFALTPLSGDQKKPGPYMMLMGMQRLGVSPDEVLMVGDSRGADIRAANWAGIHSVLVDPHGNTMHPGVRNLRYPVERTLHKSYDARQTSRGLDKAPLEDSPKRENMAQIKVLDIASANNPTLVDYEPDFDVPGYIADKGKLVGFGNPVHELSQHHRDKLGGFRVEKFDPFVEKSIENIQGAPGVREFIEWAEKDPRFAANAVSLSRLVLGPAISYSLRNNTRGVAFVQGMAKEATDWIDGWVSGMEDERVDYASELERQIEDLAGKKDLSSRGKRAGKLLKKYVRELDGAQLDRNTDRASDYPISTALVEMGRKPEWVHKVQIGREVLRNVVQIPIGRLLGLETASDQPTKNSAVGVGFANLLSMIPKEPGTVDGPHELATAYKISTAILSMRVWMYRDLRTKNAEHIRQQLTAGTEWEEVDVIEIRPPVAEKLEQRKDELTEFRQKKIQQLDDQLSSLLDSIKHQVA